MHSCDSYMCATVTDTSTTRLIRGRYRAWKREDNERKQYDSAVDRYVVNMRYHEKYQEQAHREWKQVQAALKQAGSDSAQTEYLKEQTRMRVFGCGWDE